MMVASPFSFFLPKRVPVCPLVLGEGVTWSHVGLLLASAVEQLVQFLGPPSSGLLCGVMFLSMRLKSTEVNSKRTQDLLTTGHTSLPVYICGL